MFYTCAILHNILLEYDGLATRWDEENVAWDMINPQTGNGDDGYDIDGLGCCQTRSQQEQRILNRVKLWQCANEDEYEGNEIEEEVELLFEDKRLMFCNHFNIAYNKVNVSWPRGFNPYQS